MSNARDLSKTKPLILGAAQASTSGTSREFIDIPSWAKRITISLSGVSTNGSSQPMIQIGTSGGFQATGYSTSSTSITTGVNASTNYSNGWQLYSGSSASVLSGSLTLVLVDPATGTWAGSGIFSSFGPGTLFIVGSKQLSGTLDRIRLTTAGGTDTFDAGSVNIMYE